MTFHLPVGDGHELYVEESGNPEGQPIIVLHGGARRSGRGRAIARYSIPNGTRLIAFDQRGAGRSRPSGLIENNTTWHLVEDIEVIRKHLGIERWHVAGGSWGSTPVAGLCPDPSGKRERAVYLGRPGWQNRRTQDWLFKTGANHDLPPKHGIASWSISHPTSRKTWKPRPIAGSRATTPGLLRSRPGRWATWETASVNFHPPTDLVHAGRRR